MTKVREMQVERETGEPIASTMEKPIDHRPRRSGIAGVIFTVILIAGAIGLFAYSQGSFQSAGRETDQAAAQVERQVDAAVVNTGDALEAAGDNAKQAANEGTDGETASN